MSARHPHPEAMALVHISNPTAPTTTLCGLPLTTDTQTAGDASVEQNGCWTCMALNKRVRCGLAI